MEIYHIYRNPEITGALRILYVQPNRTLHKITRFTEIVHKNITTLFDQRNV